MNKVVITKNVVNFASGYVLGIAGGNILRTFVPRNDNKVVDTAISAAIFTTSYFASSMIHDKLKEYTDAQIDEFYENFKFEKN